jgi:hypothetical protein
VQRGLDDDAEDPLLQDAKAMGASERSLQQLRGAIEERRHARGHFGVWPRHWHAVQIFCAMGTQWRTHLGAKGLIYQGLDYAALRPVLAEHRHGQHRQPMEVLMPQLRTLELAAREHLND